MSCHNISYDNTDFNALYPEISHLSTVNYGVCPNNIIYWYIWCFCFTSICSPRTLPENSKLILSFHLFSLYSLVCLLCFFCFVLWIPWMCEIDNTLATSRLTFFSIYNSTIKNYALLHKAYFRCVEFNLSENIQNR